MIAKLNCPDCEIGLGSTGRCAKCDGTGVNPQLNSPEPKCEACLGTGVCPACGGTGSSIWKEERIKLFP